MKYAIVLSCYTLSGFGIFLMMLGSFGFLQHFGIYIPVAIAWILALWAHQRMALAWIDGVRLGRGFSLVALALGFLGLLAFPLAASFVGRHAIGVSQTVFVVALELVPMLPAVVLAGFLNWYHAGVAAQSGQFREDSSHADA